MQQMTSRINTKPQDIEAFSQERNIMLEEKRNFKFGSAPHGLAALNSLQSMYMVFIYPEHFKHKKDDIQPLIEKIKQLRAKLIHYSTIHAPINDKDEKQKRKQNLSNDDFISLINEFDDLEMYIISIKTEVGL